MLASEAEGQVRYLKSLFGMHQLDPYFNVDELALEFDDVAVLAPQLVADKLVSPEAAGALQKLDEFLDGMSGLNHADLWTVSSLATAHEWAVVRTLAQDCLALLPSSA